MKPLKSLTSLSIWILRVSILLFVLFVYFNSVKSLAFTQISFYIALVYIIFSASLFFGGFLKTHKITVISALVLCLITGYQLIMFRNSIDYNFSVYIIIGAISLFFLSVGNKNHVS